MTLLRVWLVLGATILLTLASVSFAAGADDEDPASVEYGAVEDALKTLSARVPTWEKPAIITDPVEARDFTTAAKAASAAQRWVENAWQADQDLPAMEALDRTKEQFENAESLEQLEAGAALAEQWAQAANAVANAFAKNSESRDLLAALGLWGTDVRSALDAALEAAIAGDVAEAFNKSAEVIDVLNGASSAGAVRLAGLVFAAVIALFLVGMWRWRGDPPSTGFGGPPWATSG